MSIALVTGASSGIGAVYARRLAARGHDLILVARTESRLRSFAAGLAEETGRNVQVQVADLAIAADRARIETILTSNEDIEILVNNAGVGAVLPLVDSDADQIEQMIEVNITALTRLTYAFVPQAIRRGVGTVVNIGSVVGTAPEILNGVYGASKAYVLAFTQSLHTELADTGVRVQVVLPNATATPFWDAAGRPLPETMKIITAEDLVDAALADLDQEVKVSIPPLHDYALWETYETARQGLTVKFREPQVAPRYQKAQ